jgi:hypothetical protein
MRLTLHKHTLSELTPDELSTVAGGAPIPTWYDGCVTTVYPSVPECWPGGTR